MSKDTRINVDTPRADIPSGYAMPTPEQLRAMPPYARRDTEELGEFYFRHVDAMTKYQLYEKNHIAAELAYRDWLLAAQAAVLKATLDENQQLRDKLYDWQTGKEARL